jgi:hypothetical protein
MNWYWIIGIMFVLVLFFVLALCKAAKLSDEKSNKAFLESMRKQHEQVNTTSGSPVIHE